MCGCAIHGSRKCWAIHGLPAQSKDPYFEQRNPWIVPIHGLRITYIQLTGVYTYIYTSGQELASPPGHSPKAERFAILYYTRNHGIRNTQFSTEVKLTVISKTSCTFREFVRARLDIYVRSNLHQQ